MWRGEARRGRAGQAFEFGEPGVVDGATANSLAADYHGPRQVDQIAQTKPLTRSCLRILDQSLEPREPALQGTGRWNRPASLPSILRVGWTIPYHSRRMQLTSDRAPAPDVDAPRWVTRCSNRTLCLSCDSSLLESRSPPHDASAGRSRPWPECCPHRIRCPIPRTVDSSSARSIRLHNGRRQPGTTNRPRACRWADSPAHRGGRN
jgi:hypothetical protein